jgi:hypothetical protein
MKVRGLVLTLPMHADYTTTLQPSAADIAARYGPGVVLSACTEFLQFLPQPPARHGAMHWQQQELQCIRWQPCTTRSPPPPSPTLSSPPHRLPTLPGPAYARNGSALVFLSPDTPAVRQLANRLAQALACPDQPYKRICSQASITTFACLWGVQGAPSVCLVRLPCS